MTLLSLSFAFVYLRILSYSFFLSFLIFFFFPAFFLPQTFLAFRYTTNKNEACVCIYMCAHITRIWYRIWYTISTFVACLCYFPFFLFLSSVFFLALSISPLQRFSFLALFLFLTFESCSYWFFSLKTK